MFVTHVEEGIEGIAVQSRILVKMGFSNFVAVVKYVTY
jgi:hypothetical protein